jgi:hypothetical protein
MVCYEDFGRAMDIKFKFRAHVLIAHAVLFWSHVMQEVGRSSRFREL